MQVSGGSLDINHCCIQGWTGTFGGTENIGDDPLFVDFDGVDNVVGTEDDNLRLLPESPCIDAGDNSAITGHDTDIQGNLRIVNSVVDIGAYEYQGWVSLTLDSLWMYQNLQGSTNSRLRADVSVSDDPMDNSSYSYHWELILPSDVTKGPNTVDGAGSSDPYWTLAAFGCEEPNSISDSGQAFKIRVTVTGDDYGNTAVVEAQFGVALLGDVNNDCVVDVADRSIVNAFWKTGSAESYSLHDCDLNCDCVVDVADRSIANAIWRGTLGQNSVVGPCPFR